jgi:acyl carrier protein
MVCLGGEPVMARDVDSCRRHFGPDCLFANLLASTEAGSIAVHRVRVDDRLEPAPLPAGRPVAGIDVSLRDGRGAEVAFGEIGEIVVSSPYLSPGYWSDPILTAERFAEDSSGRRFRTGDLARFLPGGALALIGRRDLEVKVRGARIGLSEVETALAAAPGVAAAAVCPTPGVDGGPRLTAYVVGDAGTTLTPAGLRDALRQTLPDRELPTGFVFVDRLPLTVHGKVDRRRLERLPPPAPMVGEPAVSTTETEAVVAAIWADAFGLDQVAAGDDFFDLGGDSLTAIVIAAGIEQRLGANIDLRTVVESRTVAGMARTLEPRGSTGDGARRTALDRAWPGDHLPVSYAQERMWLGSRTPEGSGRYTMAAGVRLRGQLDVPALRRALEYVVRRHDVLHTTFADRDGRLTQVVHAPEPLEVPLLDRSGVEDPQTEVAAVLRDEVRRRVDLRRGPLIRFRLVRTAPEEHHLLWVHHHIVSDAWSWRVFFDELELLYPALRGGDPPPLPGSLPSQYGDFAASERHGLDRSAQLRASGAAWWRETLAAVPPSPRLPFARTTAHPGARVDDGVIWWGLPEQVSERLDVMARETAATPYMVRLAAFAAHLARETGRHDLVLGGYATGRMMVETQAMFGLFANPVTLLLRLAPDLTFRQLLARVGAYVLAASSWSQLPFDLLCADLRDHGLSPPDIRVVFDVAEGLPRELCGLEVTPVRSVPAAMPWEFSLMMDRRWEAGECRAQFDARIHDPDGVRAFIRRFQRLLAAVCSEPDRPIADVASPVR